MESINKYDSYANAVRSLGEVVLALDQLDIPELSITEEQVVEEVGTTWIEKPEDDAYQDIWASITAIVKQYIGEVDKTRTRAVSLKSGSDGVSEHKMWVEESLTAGLHVEGEEVAILSVGYTGLGDLAMTAEYRRPFAGDNWAVLWEGEIRGKDIDPVAIGREIASIELTYLVHETGSNAAALDYWQTHHQDGWYQQHEWADIRGVGRQTVNDRIRHTRRSLEPE